MFIQIDHFDFLPIHRIKEITCFYDKATITYIDFYNEKKIRTVIVKGDLFEKLKKQLDPVQR